MAYWGGGGLEGGVAGVGGSGEGGVILGCFVETLNFEERRVAGGDFRCNLVKNWSGEKMCLVGIRVDRSLDVSV